MALRSSSDEKSAGRRAKSAGRAAEPSRLRSLRQKQHLTQAEVARRTGMHRNSIRNIENGTTREITAENANALAEVLDVSVVELGMRVRASVEARSIRFRKLSPEQRAIVDEVLSLPPEDYRLIRGAVEKLRRKRRAGGDTGEGK